MYFWVPTDIKIHKYCIPKSKTNNTILSKKKYYLHYCFILSPFSSSFYDENTLYIYSIHTFIE